MKKTNTSNPLKFFNDAKAARNKAFSKSLIKAQDGRIGPMTQQEAAAETAANSYPIPYATPTPVMNSSRPTGINPIDAMGVNTERMSNMDKGNYNSSGTMQASSAAYQKKGGSVRRKK